MEIIHNAGDPRSIDRGTKVEETVQKENFGAYEALHTGGEVKRILYLQSARPYL